MAQTRWACFGRIHFIIWTETGLVLAGWNNVAWQGTMVICSSLISFIWLVWNLLSNLIMVSPAICQTIMSRELRHTYGDRWSSSSHTDLNLTVLRLDWFLWFPGPQLSCCGSVLYSFFHAELIGWAKIPSQKSEQLSQKSFYWPTRTLMKQQLLIGSWIWSE